MFLGLKAYFVNTVAGDEIYAYRGPVRYIVATAKENHWA